ncbi:MAG: ComF family protein [Ignavibacteriales bacterium]|nr:ComF family protein [Ignavibacteriales bacterium]
MGDVVSWVGRRLQPLRDFLFPPLCFSCNERLRDGEVRVCPLCWGSLSLVSENDDTHKILSGRFALGGAIDGFWSYCYFEHGGVFQKLAHALKYEGVTWCGVEFGRRLAAVLPHDLTIDGIVPVPLHTVRLRERGYNQSEHICRGIHELLHTAIMPSLLRRVKNTVTQTHLTADQRKHNIEAAFTISGDASAIRDRTFLLVDDIITTGSTLQEAAAVLKQAGAAHVYVASAGLAQLEK